jgi:Holliday junction resolvase RusA-like endonuclease
MKATTHTCGPDEGLIAFTVPGEAVPWSRAGSNSGQRFTPRKQANFMGAIKLFASQAMAGTKPFEGPVELSIRATYLIPASWPAKRKAAASWKTSKPDADNLGKIVADALNALAYADDAQVASLIVQKRYGPLAGLTISVASLEP